MRFVIIRPAFTLLLAGLLSTLAGTMAVASPRQKVALLPLSGTNVHPGYLDAGRDILKDHLLGTGRFDVITVAGESGAVEIAGADAVAKGREVGAELAIVAHLSRLSGAGRIRLLAYRVADGGLAHADSMAIAGGPDDLDPALRRLAVGLSTGKRVEDTAEIDSVTQRESDPYLKQSATKIFGLKLGTAIAFNRPGEKDPGGFPGIGIFWMYDARRFLADISLDLLFKDDEGGVFVAGLGGYYPFMRGDFTPYAGLQAAFSSGSYGGDAAAGIRLTPVVGVLLGRLSTVQFRGEIGYFFNTYGEKPEETPLARPGTSTPGLAPTAMTGAGSERFTHGLLFSVGLGF